MRRGEPSREDEPYGSVAAKLYVASTPPPSLLLMPGENRPPDSPPRDAT